MTSGSAPYPSQPASTSLTSMASSCAKMKRGSYQSRQRRMGPAPFASFEDLSDELESPDEGKSQRALLPGIREDSVGTGLGQEVGVNLLAAAVGLQTPSTPRIDISRASSSSQHEDGSGGSSGGAGGGSPEGRDPLAVGLSTGFKEEGAAELRSSTEELDYHGGGRTSSDHHQTVHRMGQQQEPRRRSAERMTSPSLQSSAKYELDTQSEKERKDSGCSEGPLLLGVTGRSSRLSSVGSAGSGASGMSGLSVTSALSGAASSSGMRSPSPHKMLLETSFCGSKPIPTKSMEIEDAPIELDSVAKLKKDGSFEIHTKPVTLDLTTDPTCSSASPQLPGGVGTKQMTPSSSSQSCQSVSRAVSSQQSSATSGTKSVSSTPSVSPKFSRHAMWRKGTAVEGSPVAEDVVQSPSPANSRKSSFTGLFGRRSDSGNLLSPESPTVGSISATASSTKHRGSKGAISAAIGGLRDRSRSRSKSREHIEQAGLSVAQVSASNATSSATSATTSPVATEPKTKKESLRNKGVFSSFFKKKEKSKKLKVGSSCGGPSLGDTASEGDPLSPDTLSPDTDGKIIVETIGNVEFTFNGTVGFQKSDYSVVETENELILAQVSEKEHVKMNAIENLTIDEVEDSNLSQKTSLVIQDDEGKPEPEADLFGEVVDTSSMQPTEGEHHSSESEREVEYLHSKHKLHDGLSGDQCNDNLILEMESKGLVLQQDSFEDELPYIPTTLPQERSVALPIKPVRQRTLAEIKTCPIERPRSTTPINPCALEEFLVAASSSLKAPSSSSGSSSVEDRLRISLPREDSVNSSDAPTLPPRSKSPRAPTPVSNWVQFTEDGLSNLHDITQRNRKPSRTSGTVVEEESAKRSASPPPPPLPPRGFHPAPPKQWVNFEEIPEKRKAPKKLHDVSSVEERRSKSAHHHKMVYSYVNPEDCKCECHETGRLGDVVQHSSEKISDACSSKVTHPESSQSFIADKEKSHSEGGEDVREVSRLDVDNFTDRHSYQSDSSCEFPNNYSVDQRDAEFSSEGLLKPMKPFGMDLDVSSNRSSIISQDEPVSPENDMPNQEVLDQ